MKKSILVLCVVFINVLCKLDIFRSKTIRFNVFRGTCPEYPNAPISYSNIQLSSINRTFFVSLKLHIKKDIGGDDLKLVLNLKRCSSNDALDSCETYNTIKVNHFCNILVDQGKPWSPFRKFIQPPTTGCPIKKGEHEIRNGTFDGSAFSHFPVSNFYWKITVLLLTVPQEEVVLCNKVEGQIAPI